MKLGYDGLRELDFSVRTGTDLLVVKIFTYACKSSKEYLRKAEVEVEEEEVRCLHCLFKVFQFT